MKWELINVPSFGFVCFFVSLFLIEVELTSSILISGVV